MGLHKIYYYLFILLLLVPALVNAQNQTCIYFFYGEGCPHCASVEPLIDGLEEKADKYVAVHRFEIYNNRSNMILLNEYFDAYSVANNDRGIPVVFISDKYLIGDKLILSDLENIINENIGAECPSIAQTTNDSSTGSETEKEKIEGLSLLTIIGAALVDSINPCAIAVLLILLGALLASGDKKKALRAGFAFTISIYISYFLFGLGLFSALQISGLSYWFYKAIGILAIIVGLANIKDFIWYGGAGFVMEIPHAWRPTLKKMLGAVTSPFGAFLMGFIVCLFELPCTGGPYIVILGLLAEKMTMTASIPLLLLYNVVFVLPLVVITLMIYTGFANVEKATEWKDKNIRKLHLIAGIIMLVLGIIIITGII